MTTVENARLFAATLTANGTLAAGKHNPVDASGGPRTVALPLSATSGAHLSVEKRDSSANAVTVSGSIRGSITTLTLPWQYETLTLRYDGGTWIPTEGHKTKASLDATYGLYLNVKDPRFGAKGDGTTDDTAAINGAIAAAVSAGGATVYLPGGTYLVTSSVRTTDPSLVSSDAGGGHAIVIGGSNIRLLGAGRDQTKIRHRGLGNTDPNTAWQIVSGKVWRGGGIWIASGALNTTISNLELDGGATYTGLRTFPASTTTGDGWDLTHKGVWLRNDGTFDNTTIEHCHIHNYRGEVVYAGGQSNGRITGRYLEIHDTNGDCWSVSAQVLLEDSHLYKSAGHGIEDAYISKPATYRNNLVTDCLLTGIHVEVNSIGGTAPGPCHVVGNTVMRCVQAGLDFVAPRHCVGENNTVIDCGTGAAGNRAIQTSTRTGLGVRDFILRNNRVLYETVSATGNAIFFTDGFAAGMVGVTVTDNLVEVTATGTTNGVTLGADSFDFAPVLTADPSAVIRGNTARNTVFRYTDQSSAREVLLTGTGSTVVAKRRPSHPTNFIIHAYARVVTAVTTLTIQVRWYDASGVQQSANLINAVSEAVGGVFTSPISITAQGATESQYVEIRFTAGTANQVYASAHIQELG